VFVINCVCAVNADSVDWSEIKVTYEHNEDYVTHIVWPDPPSPNGVILLYELQLARADVANVRCTCWMHYQISLVLNTELFSIITLLSILQS